MKYDKSKFKLYSIGIVSQNKKLDEDTCYIMPIEVTPFVDGELDAKLEEVIGEGKNKDNENYTVTVSKSSSIKAKWLRVLHTNRRTSPDVRRGERVLLYRYADSQDFYWDSMGMDDHLRKLETVIWSWSDTKEEYQSVDSTDPEQSYTFEISTHNKLVTFRTVKADGEPYAYTFQLDTKYGNFILTDDDGNYFQLDSPETSLKMVNKDKSVVHLNKKKVWINGDEEVRIKSGATEVIHTPSGTKHYTPKFEGIKHGGNSGFIGEFVSDVPGLK